MKGHLYESTDAMKSVSMDKTPGMEKDSSMISIEDEILDTETFLEQERLEMEREKAEKLAAKKEAAFQRKKKNMMCCIRFCCFKDEEREFDPSLTIRNAPENREKMPSYTQICCWRFLRARRRSNRFYTD